MIQQKIHFNDIRSHRIKYQQCDVQNHNHQKLNFICLNQGCKQKSLICSVCRYDTHQNHFIQPLKYYLEEVRNKFDIQNSQNQLQQLSKSRTSFLLFLQECVQKIAQQFRKLEEDVLGVFQDIRQQILQKAKKKKQFEEFYKILTTTSQTNYQIEMQKYLPKSIKKVSDNYELIDSFMQRVISQINDLKNLLIIQTKDTKLPNQTIKGQQFLMSPNIVKENTIYSLKDKTQYSLCILNIKLIELAGSLKFKIIEMGTDDKIVFGTLSDQYKNKTNFEWTQQISPDLKWVSSDNKSSNANYTYLSNVAVGASIYVKYKKGHLKIVFKKKNADIITKENHYCFFALKGSIKVQLLYPHK